jgi:hypothetical protein
LDELVQRLQLLLRGATDLLAEYEYAFVNDPVVDAVALLAAAEHADVGEHSQVLRHVLLRGAESIRELANRSLTVAKVIEQPDSHRLGEHPEAACDELGEVLWNRVWE